MKALFKLFRRFDARRIFGLIRRLGGMSRPKVKCYDLRSTRALRVEGDVQRRRFRNTDGISIHALRVEGDSETNAATSARDAISIHALRVEGDRTTRSSVRTFLHFYPRPPGGGRRLKYCRKVLDGTVFLSTPSGWRATWVQSLENGQILLFLSTPSGWRATSRF